jgi:hypothetical protein
MPELVKIWTVTPIGVGRADYSKSVERQTESVTRSWQEDYQEAKIILDIPPGSSVTEEIDTGINNVVLLYDLRLVTEINVLIGLEIQEQATTGEWTRIYKQLGYTRIIDKISKGLPIFRNYRVIAYNFSNVPIDVVFSTSGIKTTRETYELELISGGG